MLKSSQKGQLSKPVNKVDIAAMKTVIEKFIQAIQSAEPISNP